MSKMSDTEPGAPGPYAQGASVYWAAGWKGCLPLPASTKGPVPKGYTGNAGTWPSYPDVMAWAEDRGAGNIALRLPPNVLGIDVDHYDAKPGGRVLWGLEQQLGALPPTWRTTSRDDGISGIRLFRIPVGLRWPGVLGAGIETIRYEHRYAVVWPSAHPNGGTYRWITPEGATSLGSVPTIDALPELPAAWVAYFTGGAMATDQARATMGQSAVAAWLLQRGVNGAPCRHMESALAAGLVELTAGGARHDAALALTNRLTWLMGEGHRGGAFALEGARQAFLKAAAGARPGLEEEWARMVEGAVKLAAAAHPHPNDDPCDNPFAALLPKDTSWTAPTPPSSSPSSVKSLTPSTPSPAPASTATGSSPSTVDGSAPTVEALADDLTELQIRRNQAAAAEVERLRAQRTAARLLEVEDEELTIGDRVRRRLLDDRATVEYKRVTEPPAPPFDAGTIAEILARPADPPMRAEGLIPWAASTLLVAQRKTGKTTMLLNKARCLLTGEDFLGEFPVIPLAPDASVAYLNYEVSGAQLARWAHEGGVPEHRLFMVNLRGRRNPLSHPEDRAALAAEMRARNVQAVIVDPFGRAYTGVSQNDNGEVQAFLLDLEMFVRTEVGATDLYLATHAGWDGERTRGASALEDWGDVIITLTRDPEDESRRFMKAMGRDVEVEEDELAIDEHRQLTRTGNGSRKTSKNNHEAAYLANYAVRAARMEPGCNKARIAVLIDEMDDAPNLPKKGRRDGRLKEAIEFAVSKGFLRVDKGAGPRGSDLHYDLTTSTASHHLREAVGGGPTTTSTAVLEAVEVVVPAGGAAEHDPSGGGGAPARPATFTREVQGETYVFDRATMRQVNPVTGEAPE